jgi:hypothetical protein
VRQLQQASKCPELATHSVQSYQFGDRVILPIAIDYCLVGVRPKSLTARCMDPGTHAAKERTISEQQTKPGPVLIPLQNSTPVCAYGLQSRRAKWRYAKARAIVEAPEKCCDEVKLLVCNMH